MDGDCGRAVVAKLFAQLLAPNRHIFPLRLLSRCSLEPVKFGSEPTIEQYLV